MDLATVLVFLIAFLIGLWIFPKPATWIATLASPGKSPATSAIRTFVTPLRFFRIKKGKDLIRYIN